MDRLKVSLYTCKLLQVSLYTSKFKSAVTENCSWSSSASLTIALIYKRQISFLAWVKPNSTSSALPCSNLTFFIINMFFGRLFLFLLSMVTTYETSLKQAYDDERASLFVSNIQFTNVFLQKV